MSKLHKIATEENQKQQERELRRIYKLSQREYWLTILIGLLLPVGAYLYTRRWRAMGIAFLCLVAAAIFFPNDSDEDLFSTPTPLVVLAGIAAAADNANAIRWAREQVENDLSHDP